jgi:SOS-response transcriptional repressor LexA
MTLKQTALALGRSDLSPSHLQYHLEKLESQGRLFIDRKRQEQVREGDSVDDQLLAIPIVGRANCGPASILAFEVPEGYLRLSKRILKSAEGLIAIVASGKSMNQAQVHTPTKGVKAPINDGDIVIVDTNDKSVSNGYVLSIIDGMANIKKIEKRQFDTALVSESRDQELYPPIIITPEDDYMINGRIIMVCQP